MLIAFVGYFKDDDFIRKVGIRLRELRLSRNLSQEDIALHSGFPPSQIGRMERGQLNTSISHIAAYARALGVHPKEIFEVEFE